MVVTKVKQIKSVNKLAAGIDYIENGAKTISSELIESDLNFPVHIVDGKISSQLVSGHMIESVEAAYSEFMLLKQSANLINGRPINHESLKENDVLAHHVIQSFSPEDNLSPEEIHEIGRKTALELTGGRHQFVIATHMDKGHLHNHIYINSTDSVTLNKFRWQKGTKKSLEQISDKYADLAGAKILERNNQFGHKEYQAYQKENIFKVEIKERLEFLLKQSTDLKDFKEKAQLLNLKVDFSGEYAKYRLLDREQKRNTRDRALSKKGRYSLDKIEERISKNELVFSKDVIKAEFEKWQEEKAEDYEIQLKIEPWQIEAETATGIYLEMEYGVANKGTVKIPSRLVDRQEDGGYAIFIKRSDFFYFINPDQSSSNRFMKGTTLINQLSNESGEYALHKNPYISRLDNLVREYNYLVRHDVTNSSQFLELRDRFVKEVEDTQATLKLLDDKAARLNQVYAALEGIHSDSREEAEAAYRMLEGLSISPDTRVEEIKKQIVELGVERKALKDKFDQIVKDFTQYEKIEKNSIARKDQNKPKQIRDELER